MEEIKLTSNITLTDIGRLFDEDVEGVKMWKQKLRTVQLHFLFKEEEEVMLFLELEEIGKTNMNFIDTRYEKDECFLTELNKKEPLEKLIQIIRQFEGVYNVREWMMPAITLKDLLPFSEG